MKKFQKLLLEALHRRLMILLEHEPCDAVQTAYFDTLYAMRGELSAETQINRAELRAVRRTENFSGKRIGYRGISVK